jgi:hypothetical protein
VWLNGARLAPLAFVFVNASADRIRLRQRL